MPRPRVLFAALVAASCLGAGIALAVVYAAGGFDRTTTTETRVIQQSDPGPQAPADAGWASKVYAERIGGVVTVLVDDGTSGVTLSGAGFVVDAKRGWIITNSHVVTDSAEKDITPTNVQAYPTIFIQRADTARTTATLVGYDLFDDIAVLHYDPSRLHLSAVPLGSSADVLVGEPVAAIGAPFGQVDSLSAGIVSQIGTQIVAPAAVCFRTTDAIQTDAAINPGNSGGPLFNSAGQVIGVNSQIATDSSDKQAGSGVAFAVPIDAAKRSLAQLTTSGIVRYPFLGVGANTLTPDIAADFRLKPTYGAQVAFVDPKSGAAQAGISPGVQQVAVDGRQVHKDGDVIVGFGGKTVRTLQDLQRDVAVRNPGDRVEIDWWHLGKLKRAKITIGEARPTDPDVCAASAAP